MTEIHRTTETGFGIPFLADMVRERVSVGSTLKDAIQWVANEAELRSEAIAKLRRAVCPDHHYRAMGMCPFCGDRLHE